MTIPVEEPAELGLREVVAEVLGRWPSAGLAVGVVRDGSLGWFFGHGVADVRSRESITEETVFRVGSLTKTFAAVAVMQPGSGASSTSAPRRTKRHVPSPRWLLRDLLESGKGSGTMV